MKYNRSIIVSRAWEIKGKHSVDWPEAMRRAWACSKAEPVNSERILMAQRAAGIPRDVFAFTWKQWHDLGFEVIHGSKARFKVELLRCSTGIGRSYTASFFTFNQVQPIKTAI